MTERTAVRGTRPTPIDANLTVAIATLNRPDGLARCLDGVLGGEVLPAEIVVVDQGKGEEAHRMLEALGSEQRGGSRPVRIEYVRQARRGLSASRNAALERASMPFVAMTDDDCVPSSGWLGTIAGAFALPSQPAAVSGRILPLGPPQPGFYPVSSRPSLEPLEHCRKTPPWLVASGGNFAVRKEAWARLGGFDERLGAGSPGMAAEDIDFAYRLLRSQALVRYEPGALLYHEQQELARRTSTRHTYGYGIGAFCGKWLRRGDPYALRLLAIWLAWRTRELGGAAIRGRHQAARERWLMLRGTLLGLRYGLALGGTE